MEEYNSSSETGTQAITSAKKAIAAIRYDAFRKKASRTYQMREVNTQELSEKVIGILCGIDLTKKTEPKDETTLKKQYPFHSRITSTEENKNIKAISTQSPGISTRTAACECCGNNGIEKTCLVKIDSGQLLCPDCLKLLRDAAFCVKIRQERGERGRT